MNAIARRSRPQSPLRKGSTVRAVVAFTGDIAQSEFASISAAAGITNYKYLKSQGKHSASLWTYLLNRSSTSPRSKNYTFVEIVGNDKVAIEGSLVFIRLIEPRLHSAYWYNKKVLSKLMDSWMPIPKALEAMEDTLHLAREHAEAVQYENPSTQNLIIQQTLMFLEKKLDRARDIMNPQISARIADILDQFRIP